jgi:hypothetical protein
MSERLLRLAARMRGELTEVKLTGTWHAGHWGPWMTNVAPGRKNPMPQAILA